MTHAPVPAAQRQPVVTPVLTVLALMWGLEIIDALTGRRLDAYGIAPRSLEGLVGIPLAPFLHGGFGHLVANTVPLLVLGLLVSWRSPSGFWSIAIGVTVIGGAGVWLVGAAGTVTIGASGVVFGFLTYLIASGLRARHWLDIVVAVVVVVAYGGLLWGAIPGGVPPGVSWLAHLTGAMAGVFLAYREP